MFTEGKISKCPTNSLQFHIHGVDNEIFKSLAQGTDCYSQSLPRERLMRQCTEDKRQRGV